MLEAGKSLTTSGSALFLDTLTGIVDWYKNSPLGNERGDTGDGEGESGDWDLDGGDGGEGEGAGGEGEGAEAGAEGGGDGAGDGEGEGTVAPKKAKPAGEGTQKEEGEGGEGDGAGDGEGEGDGGEAGGEGDGDGEAVITPEMQTLMDSNAALLAQNENLTNVSNFYEKRYSEVMKPKVETPPSGGAEGAAVKGPAESLPAEIVPPEKWDLSDGALFSKQIGDYVAHQGSQAEQLMNERYTDHVVPAFDRFNGAINMIVDQVFKSQNKDWDETIQSVQKELFVFDAEGKSVIGVKNQAVLDYIQAQPIPKLAMYQYGLAQTAPAKIKEGVKKNTKNVIKKITQKPKGPTKAAVAEGASADVAALDWDSSGEAVEKQLEKDGLI